MFIGKIQFLVKFLKVTLQMWTNKFTPVDASKLINFFSWDFKHSVHDSPDSNEIVVIFIIFKEFVHNINFRRFWISSKINNNKCSCALCNIFVLKFILNNLISLKYTKTTLQWRQTNKITKRIVRIVAKYNKQVILW